jgi:CubicO group peptidase (beta-lactamase class C family)
MQIHAKITLAIVAASLTATGAAPDEATRKDNGQINKVLRQIAPYVRDGMQKTGVPGVAIAVVYRDKVVYLEGFGIRKAGAADAITPDTVFQLASVSKPIASTIVASLVGDRQVSWDDRIVDLDPDFSLSDADVTQQLTIRDLLSHRSGLPTSSGDALEDLGFTRPVILHQMRLLPLTGNFRKGYQYSNFGYTEGAIAASKTSQLQWEDLAYKRLFQPVGMTSTSYRYSDYENRSNKASIHVIIDGKPIARYHRDPDAEAPAGSASSSIRDLAEWLRLQLAGGAWNGQTIVQRDALKETHSPQIQNGTDNDTGKPTYYGLGWGVGYDASGEVMLSHSGAFFLGTGTTVRFSPSKQLGIIVLTNAQPTGLAEATAFTFFDLYNNVQPVRDWLTIFSAAFKGMIEESNNETTDYSKVSPPSSPAPSKPLSTYVGTYCNNYYGSVDVTEQGGSLWMRFPDEGRLYTLAPWDGDKFTYRFEEEQGIGARGVSFALTGAGTMSIENLALEGSGEFARCAR